MYSASTRQIVNVLIDQTLVELAFLVLLNEVYLTVLRYIKRNLFNWDFAVEHFLKKFFIVLTADSAQPFDSG